MRLTWYSNAPWAKSGYGIQTSQAVRRLAKAGHAVAIAANYGLQGTRIPDWQDGIPIFPSGKNRYSDDVTVGHHRIHRGDWLITLYDVWGLDPAFFKDARVASWVPIDHQPVPPAVANWCRQHYSMAWSRFGMEELAKAGVDARYLPLAVETQEYHPRDRLVSGRNVREVLGVPQDAFLVVVNAANKGNHPPRKGWGEMFLAFAIFAARHPDAYLYAHTDPFGQQGIDLPVLATGCNIPVDRLVWADEYAYLNGMIPEADLAAIYTSADVLLATSYAEGFGVPIIEAQACGTPVIVTDWTAMPELVGAGWVVPAQPMWDAPHASFLGMPFVGEIVRSLEDAYASKGDAAMGERAIAFAQQYDADRVFAEHWQPVLRELESLLPQPPNRAERRRKRK